MTPKSMEGSDLRWKIARRSAGNGACVEIAPMAGAILIRDSKDPDGPILRCSPETFRSFLDASRNGIFPD